MYNASVVIHQCTSTVGRELLYYMSWDLFGDVGIHHKIVDVFFCSGELQLPGDHGHHQHGAAGPLRRRQREPTHNKERRPY